MQGSIEGGNVRTPVRGSVTFALLAVYLIWGSTYLVLHYALESFPPFLLGGVRYTLAGLILYALARRRSQPRPSARAWGAGMLIGTLLFALGNGLVGVAQQSITSGVAAVVVATTSLWAVLFAAAWGTRPTRGELAGLLLGLTAVVLLQRAGAFAGSLVGLVAILCAPLAWALGSIWSRRLPLPAGSMGAAVQMIGGGLAMLLIAAARAERVGTITPRAIVAAIYLTLFGSLVAFSAYQFLLQRTRPAVATSYAFVNPIVALVLGALIAAEPLSMHHVYACLLTVIAVLFVLRSRVA